MKRLLLIVSFAFVLFFGYTVNAKVMTGRASVGRGHVMDTSYNYYATDWKLLSDSSLNILPVPSGAGNDFYDMGTEYAFPITLTGQTDFVATVRVPVAGNTIYNYQLMDGLNQYDFKAGVDQNFAVYNVTPDIQLFNHTCGLYSHLGVAHFYCYYDITFAFTLSTPLTGAYNLNFAVFNTNGSRSSYYLSGGNTGVSIEFPTTYFNGDSWDYSVMSPTVRLTTGTTANNQDVIDQSIANTQEIKDTIQESYENLVKSQEVCIESLSSNLSLLNGYINSQGVFVSNSTFKSSDFIIAQEYIDITSSGLGSGIYTCFYKRDKTLISCTANDNLSVGRYNLPNDTYYLRFTYFQSKPVFQYHSCVNGNQALYDAFTDSNIDSGIGATFLNGLDWYENSYFSSIITSPLQFLQSLTQSCTPVTLTLFNQNVVLPCGTTIFWERDMSNIATFRVFWNILFGGFIIYKLAHKLILAVNDCLDPTKDKVGDSLV